MRLVNTLACVLFSSFLFSQVAINSPSPKTTLDVNSSGKANVPDGIMTVRVTGKELQDKDAIYGAAQNSDVVYVTSVHTDRSSKTSNVTTPGFYYYNSGLEKWIGLQMPKFFYMPSIYIDTTTIGTFTKQLYEIYANQFTSPDVKSANSLGRIPILGAKDLEYYVTYMDKEVFKDVRISDTGEMTYRIAQNASDASFLNIVFVVK